MTAAGIRRAGVIAAVVLLFAGTSPAGPAYDLARRQTEQARRDADLAQARWLNATNATRAAERAMADFRSQRDQIDRQEADARRRAADRDAEADRLVRDVAAARPSVEKLAGAAAEQKGLEATARQAWDAANSAATAAKAAAVARFEASPDWQSAVARTLAADKDLQAKTEAAVARLMATPAYQAAAKEVERLREVRDRLRDRGPDTAGLPQASEAWYTANGKIATARVDAADADPAVQAARRAAADAKRDQTATRTAFEQGLAADPTVAPALADAAAKRKALDAAVASLNAATSAADAAKRRLAADERRIPEARADARRAQDELTRFARDREALAARENAADREVDRLRFDERRAAQDRDRALQILQQAQANEERARQQDNNARRPK